MIPLPKWATRDGNVVYVVADEMYEEWLGLLGADPKKLTQYILECAYQCGKMDVQVAVGGPASGIEIRMKYSPEGKRKYGQAGKPPGKTTTKVVRGKEKQLEGAQVAAEGLEAREHYKRIRGFLPA